MNEILIDEGDKEDDEVFKETKLLDRISQIEAHLENPDAKIEHLQIMGNLRILDEYNDYIGLRTSTAS